MPSEVRTHEVGVAAGTASAVGDSRTIALEFTGGRSGTAGLTWAQRTQWYDTEWLKPDDWFYNHGRLVPVLGGVTSGEVVDVLRRLVLRHESLRTRFFVGPDGRPCQQVHGRGRIDIQVVAVPPDAADDFAATLCESVRRQRFRLEHEWPLRAALVERAGTIETIVLVLSHVAF